MLFLLLVAENATTANMITLFQHEKQLNEFKQNPSLIKNTVEDKFFVI